MPQAGELDPSRFKLLTRYSGWGPGQLQRECQAGVWLTAAASSSFVLQRDLEGDEMWHQVQRNLAGCMVCYKWLSMLREMPWGTKITDESTCAGSDAYGWRLFGSQQSGEGRGPTDFPSRWRSGVIKNTNAAHDVTSSIIVDPATFDCSGMHRFM